MKSIIYLLYHQYYLKVFPKNSNMEQTIQGEYGFYCDIEAQTPCTIRIQRTRTGFIVFQTFPNVELSLPIVQMKPTLSHVELDSKTFTNMFMEYVYTVAVIGFIGMVVYWDT